MLPCPFCGGAAKITQVNYNGAQVYCTSCGASGGEIMNDHDSDFRHDREAYRANQERAITIWNTRHG